MAPLLRSIRVMNGTAPTLFPGWSSELGSVTLLIVADGMGGHGGGDVASQSAVEAIASYLVDVLPCATSMLDSLPDDARISLHGMRAKLADTMLAGDEVSANHGMGRGENVG